MIRLIDILLESEFEFRRSLLAQVAMSDRKIEKLQTLKEKESDIIKEADKLEKGQENV